MIFVALCYQFVTLNSSINHRGIITAVIIAGTARRVDWPSDQSGSAGGREGALAYGTRTRAGASDRWRRPPRCACEVTWCRRAVLRPASCVSPSARAPVAFPRVFRPPARRATTTTTTTRPAIVLVVECVLRIVARECVCSLVWLTVWWCAPCRRSADQITVEHPSVPCEGERDMRI